VREITRKAATQHCSKDIMTVNRAEHAAEWRWSRLATAFWDWGTI